MWKFSKLKDDTEQHSLSYRYLWTGHSECPDIPYLSECGVLCRLFLIGSYHNLLLDERKSAPHFLLYIPFIILGLGCRIHTMSPYDQLKNYEWNNNATLRDFVEQLRQLKERDPEYSKEGIIDSLVSKIVNKESIYAAERGVFNINFDDIDFTTYVYVYWMIMYEFYGGDELLKPNEQQEIADNLKHKSLINYNPE